VNAGAIRLSAAGWRSLCTRVFTAWGAPTDIAECVASSLVESNLAGVDSHGVVRIVNYYDYVKPGWWLPAARPSVSRESSCTAVVDGNGGLGQPAMHLGTDLGIRKARAYGIAAVGVINCGHIGRIGEYAEKAAAAGLVAFLMTSNARYGGHVVPYGGAERVFSTNPIAAAVPADRHVPFLMDFATTVVAAGKLELSGEPDAKIPIGWAVDRHGRPATVARDYLEGGAMLPFGGHKGYALMLLVELLAGALTGAGVSQRPVTVFTGGPGFSGNSTFLAVIDPGAFTDSRQFAQHADALFARLGEVTPAPGVRKVMVPGEPEAEQRHRRGAEGFGVNDVMGARIRAIAKECGVDLSDLLQEAG